jgi:hypothetical protein
VSRLVKGESVTFIKQMRSTGLCLVAALVLSAMAAGSASATAPEYGRCIKKAKAEGKGYTANKCTVAGEGTKAKYEWVAGAEKAKFTSTGGIGVLTTVGGSEVECTAEASTGEFVPGNNKEETGIVVTFTGCKSAGLSCATPKAKPGELVTNQLEGIVGWENKAKKKTDLELYPAKSVKSGLFIEFECEGLLVKVRGKVLVSIKNDKMTQTETLKFSAKKGIQKPTKWEESPEPAILEASFSNFKGGAYEQSGQDITSTVKGEEQLELNAVV